MREMKKLYGYFEDCNLGDDLIRPLNMEFKLKTLIRFHVVPRGFTFLLSSAFLLLLLYIFSSLFSSVAPLN